MTPTHRSNPMTDKLREAANQARLALAGYVSAQSAIDMLDAALAPTHRSHDMTDTPNDMTTEERAAYAGILMAQSLAHRTATDAGWYLDPKTGAPVERNFGEVVALMHSELSEALEADRKGLMDEKLPHRDGREVEFADCIIRILDTAAALGLDVAGVIIEKNRFNKTRADHSLDARANNGKRY